MTAGPLVEARVRFTPAPDGEIPMIAVPTRTL